MSTQPKIFRPNRLKILMLFLISSAFVAIGIFALEENTLLGWFSISFFGIGIIVSLIQFYPNASYLKLNEEGFEVKSLFRTSFTKWSDVKDFREGHIKRNKMIFFDYTEEHKKWKKGKKLSKFLSGKEGAIQSSYNISTKELLNLLKEYKLKSEKIINP